MTEPKDPKHADYDFPIGKGGSRLMGRRHLAGYAYPQNGNVHNPTPRYLWLLLVDGNLADQFERKRDLVEEATNNATAYLNGAITYAIANPVSAVGV